MEVASGVTSVFRRSKDKLDDQVVGDNTISPSLSHYDLLANIGVGAYAKVYKAKVKKTKVEVAVKIISRNAAPNDYVKRFLPREMQILQVIDHPFCVKTFEIFEIGAKVHMIMDLATQGDLLDFINSRGRLPETQSRKMFSQLVSALDYFYGMSIAHRDLKCENLLLDDELNIKVSDFGFATPYKNGQLLKTFCGSVAYACPEILYGQPYDGRRSDLWSIGVVLFALVCGQLPFQEGNMKKLLMQINSPLVLPSRLSAECADLLRTILTTSLKERGTLETVKKHAWLKPKSNAVPAKRIEMPEVASKTQPTRKKIDTPDMSVNSRKRACTIDAAELGTKPKLQSPGSGTPISSRTHSPLALRPQTGSPSNGSLTGLDSPSSGMKKMDITANGNDTEASNNEESTEEVKRGRNRSMTSDGTMPEMSRHLSWKKKLRQNFTQYMSTDWNKKQSSSQPDSRKSSFADDAVPE